MIRQMQMTLLVTSCVILSVYYRCYKYYTPYRSSYIEIQIYNGTEDYLINTTGCLIPNYIKTFNLIEHSDKHVSCGERAVFVNRRNDELTFEIDENVLNREYNKNNYSYQCCYSIVSRSNKTGFEDKKINYSKCQTFKDNYRTTHTNEVYTVKCTTEPPKGIKKKVIYEDAYLILKKQEIEAHSENKWNLLVVGIDTNSRARLLKSMPKTAKYLQRHGWLDFRGYQKVGSNTLPNLGPMLMGVDINTINEECAGGMDKCNHRMIWSKFREAGYITAYSEDNLRLPDTFANLKGFKTVPTNHYTRLFYLIGEKEKGNLICTKKLRSSEHMLNYAYNFVDTYKRNSFFGVFWINSISHNINYLPGLHDENMVTFFDKINSTGALQNTFIMFLSDHGIRFGNSRKPIDAYYDERLPMLYIWTPFRFRQQYPLEYYNLQVNQNRLITPYDIHLTFKNILNLTKKSNKFNTKVACKSCLSIFQEIPESRTCDDVGVNAKWCSCGTLTPIEKNNTGVDTSLQLAASYLQSRAIESKTKACHKCKPLEISKVLRTHINKDGNRNIYVVAFSMSPINMDYEATVIEEDGAYTLVDTIYSMTGYNYKGNCVVNPNDRGYCRCFREDTPECKEVKHG